MATSTASPSSLLTRLGNVMRLVADREITPRFQRLREGEIIAKPSPDDPTDLVTLADRAAETAYNELLPDLVRGSVVVGEEAVSADQGLLERLSATAPVWLVDPLDGTRNFAAGRGPFGSMVALVEGGVILASGIYSPISGSLLVAELGQGAFLDGVLVAPSARSAAGPLRGTIYDKFMNAEQAALLAARAERHEQLPGVMCAAHEYTEVALGRKDYVVYYRLFPWDHAPGALIVREAGGCVRHPDGRDYSVFDRREPTLLTPNPALWARARGELFDETAPLPH